MTSKFDDKAISIEESFFRLHGRSKLLISGELSYFKLDPLEWEDRIRKLKASLLNCISTYVPWGLHEQEKGQFDFENRLDIARFAALAQQNQMLGILKPSGYVCDEISGGGFPGWIWPEEIRTRTSDPAYLAYLERWLDVITPMLAGMQITKGGHAILWQVENEFGYGNKPYLMHLVDRARQLGIDVPIVLNNGHYYAEEGLLGAVDYYPTPAPEQLREVAAYFQQYRETHPNKPIFSQEFEAGWLNTAFNSEVTTMGHLPRVWLESLSKLAFVNGCAGLNYFMFSGGTDPGMQPAKFFPNRYYNEAAIEEWGELGELYYRYKTTHAQLLSFESLLVNEPALLTDTDITGVPPEVMVIVRGQASGTAKLVSLSNTSDEVQSFTWQSASLNVFPTRVELQPMETKLYPIHVELREHVTWVHSSAELLYKDANVCIIFGEVGQTNELKLVWSGDQLPELFHSGALALEAGAAEEITVRFTFTHQQEDQWLCVQDYRILVISRERAMRTWFGPEKDGRRDLVISELYYAEWEASADYLRVEAEPGRTHALTLVRGINGDSIQQITYIAPSVGDVVLDGSKEIMITKWAISEDWENQFLASRAQMKTTSLGVPYENIGHLDCGYAVYRSEWESDGREQVLLIPEINDFFDVFINDEWIASGRRTLKLPLQRLRKGKNQLTLRCCSTGLDKDMALHPALSGMMLPLYAGELHTEELLSWEQKLLFSKEAKEAFFEERDQLLSYHDDHYAQEIGIDIEAIRMDNDNWSAFAFAVGSEGVLMKDANVDYAGSGEMLNRTRFVADAKLSGSRVLLEIRDCDLIYAVYVNGRHIAAIWQGWSAWGFENSPKYWDITPWVQFGEENQILLRCIMGPRGGGVLQPASISYYESAIEGEASFTPLALGIQVAMEGGLGSFVEGSLGGSETGQEGALFISKSSFTYTDLPNLVHPVYIELDGVEQFTLVYVNGELIGKYYPGGYQRKFYLWRSWLKEGANELALVGKRSTPGQASVTIGRYHTKIIDRIAF